MSDDVYSLYGSSLKDSSTPVNSSYSSNPTEVKLDKADIERRKRAAAEDINPVRVGETAHQITESMGKVEPPLGEAIAGTGKNVADNLSSYALPAAGLYGLYKLWQNFSGGPNNPPNNPPSSTPEPTAQKAPVPAPTENAAPVAPAAEGPVAPKPLSEIEQIKLDKAKFELEAAKAKEARAAELHANRLAADAKRAETKVQQGQGKAFNNQDNTILANAERIKAEKALEAAGLKKPTKQAPTASVAPPVAAPEATAPKAAAAPSTPPADKFVLPISSNPAETALTKEQTSARGWLANQYGGNNKYYEAVQDIFGGVPPSYNAAAGEKAIGKDAHQVVMDWRKANIEGPKVNLTHDMKKALKGGGGLAVLMSLPGFAEAAQNKDMGKMSDIFTDFFVLPFAQSREAGMPKAQEESTIAAKFKEASKLGSPYRSVPPPR